MKKKLSEKEEKEYYEKFNSLARFCEKHELPALIFIPIDEEGFSILFSEGETLVRRFMKACLATDETGDALTAMSMLTIAAKASIDKNFYIKALEALYEAKNTDIEALLLEEKGNDIINPNADC